MEKDSADSVLTRVRAVIAAELNLPLENVKEGISLRSLEPDSLELLSLTIALEDEFGIDIEREDMNQMATVADVVRFVERNR